MSKKKKGKKKTASPVKQLATTRSGGTTTYYRKGRECHCASKRPAGSTEERDRRRAKRSERQRLLTSVFAFVDRLVRTLSRKLAGVNSWIPFVKDTRMSFVFSVGWLAVPLYTRLRRNAWTFTLEWRPHGILDETRDDDTLAVGYFYDCLPDAPRVLHLPAVTRAAGTATFTLPDPEGPGREPLSPDTVVHIYPYLASPDTDEYTRSVYLRVPPGADDTLR